MAKVAGIKEKVHMPLYDAFLSEGGRFEEELRKHGGDRTMRFFVDIQNKTRLETNLLAAGTLPSQNSYETRSLRVITDNYLTSDNVEKLIYNSVTTFTVGEKTMIEAPTCIFPSGAGTWEQSGHGEPDPMATFRLAEPIVIEPQQSFRVDISFPREVPDGLKDVADKMRIWVVLDGYLTRDAQ